MLTSIRQTVTLRRAPTIGAKAIKDVPRDSGKAGRPTVCAGGRTALAADGGANLKEAAAGTIAVLGGAIWAFCPPKSGGFFAARAELSSSAPSALTPACTLYADLALAFSAGAFFICLAFLPRDARPRPSGYVDPN